MRFVSKIVGVLLSLVVLVASVSPAIAADWPMFRKDAVHSGYSVDEAELKPPLEAKWTFEMGQSFSGAIVVGNSIYVESGSPAVLYSLNALTGAQNWSRPTGKISHASPAYADGTILTGSHCANCAFEAFDAQTGTLKWSLPLPQGSRDPVVENGVAYFGSDDKKVRAVNISTGQLIWTSPLLNDGVTAVPAVVNGKVYVGTWNSKFYALNSGTGAKIWEYTVSPTKLVLFSSPVVADGVVYIGAGKNIIAVDANTGAHKWTSSDMNGFVGSSPAVAGGNLYLMTDPGGVYSLNANNGSLNWSYFTQAPISPASWSSPVVANGVVYVGSTDNKFYAFDKNTGELLWSQDLGATITASPVVANGMVYVGTNGGKLYAFGNDDVLDVPYQAQNDLQWKDHKYDSMEYTIGQVGCALSSATMVLKSHGINKLPDGMELNVDSLNNWLNENPDGDWRQGATSWEALKRLTRLLNDQDSNSPILDYKKIIPPDFDQIDNILVHERNALIFEEVATQSSSGVHFVSARGVNEAKKDYEVLDPFDSSRTDFLIPPDILVSARYFFPTHTNLSSLVLHADKGLEVLASNSLGNNVGQLGEQKPLVNSEDPAVVTGEAFWELYAEDPESDVYKFTFSTEQTGWYSFELYAYDKDANPQVFKQRIYVDANKPLIFILNYSQDGGSDFAKLQKQVTFESLRQEVQTLYNQGLIKKSIIKSLLSLLTTAEKNYPLFPRIVSKVLVNWEKLVKKAAPRLMTVEAKELLLNDLQILRGNLGL